MVVDKPTSPWNMIINGQSVESAVLLPEQHDIQER